MTRYSARSAMSGSTRVACHAGSSRPRADDDQHGRMRANVTGSVARAIRERLEQAREHQRAGEADLDADERGSE